MKYLYQIQKTIYRQNMLRHCLTISVVFCFGKVSFGISRIDRYCKYGKTIGGTCDEYSFLLNYFDLSKFSYVSHLLRKEQRYWKEINIPVTLKRRKILEGDKQQLDTCNVTYSLIDTGFCVYFLMLRMSKKMIFYLSICIAT